MLELTDHARKMIGELCARRRSPGAGLRIAQRPAGPGLCMSVQDEPAPGDVVVRIDQAVLYLDATARDRLAGQTLDARSNELGAAFFL